MGAKVGRLLVFLLSSTRSERRTTDKMGVLPILDRFSAPARIQRLSVFALGTILIVLVLENTFFPGTSVASLHRRVRSQTKGLYTWSVTNAL